MSRSDRLTIEVLGDSGAFSPAGKGIAYRIQAGEASFLVDCGAPVLSGLGPEALDRLDGVIITHAHDDHRRWLSDLLLHRTFTSEEQRRLRLLGSPEVLDACRHGLEPALSRTLSDDSGWVRDVPLQRFLKPIRLGPTPKYRCRHTGDDRWDVVNRDGNTVSRDRARVVLAEGVQRPRLLFRDPGTEAWVEPEAYYPFTDPVFYDPATPDDFTYRHDSGLSITPVKATAWHGPPTTSLLFEYGDETVFFSSDTVYDPDLWDRLTEPVSPTQDPDGKPWAQEHQLDGDINRFLERRWSRSRRDRARVMYESNHVMVHEVSAPNSPVHTDYAHLENRSGPLLLTHTPRTFTAVHPIAFPGKRYIVAEQTLWEQPQGSDTLYGLDAACFHKKHNRLYVGVADAEGSHRLVRTGSGRYSIQAGNGTSAPDQIGRSVTLYRDLEGRYFPRVSDDNDVVYAQRPDGKIERREFQSGSSKGTIVEDRRSSLGQPTLAGEL